MRRVALFAIFLLSLSSPQAGGQSQAPGRKATPEQARCILGCATVEQVCREACKGESCREACSKDAQGCARDCLEAGEEEEETQ